MSNFPAGFDDLPVPGPDDELDSLLVPHAGLHADLNAAVEAVQHTLGTNPQGTHPTVRDRIRRVEDAIAAGGGGGPGLSDDFPNSVGEYNNPGTSLLASRGDHTHAGGDLTEYARLDGADFTGPVTVAPSTANGRVRNVWFLSSPPTDDEGEDGDLAVVL